MGRRGLQTGGGACRLWAPLSSHGLPGGVERVHFVVRAEGERFAYTALRRRGEKKGEEEEREGEKEESIVLLPCDSS